MLTGAGLFRHGRRRSCTGRWGRRSPDPAEPQAPVPDAVSVPDVVSVSGHRAMM